MERYFKNYDGEYIFSIGIGTGDEEITKEEYDEILAVIHDRPLAEPGYSFKLRKDLTWEKVKLEAPTAPLDDDISDQEALDIILGGDKA